MLKRRRRNGVQRTSRRQRHAASTWNKDLWCRASSGSCASDRGPLQRRPLWRCCPWQPNKQWETHLSPLLASQQYLAFASSYERRISLVTVVLCKQSTGFSTLSRKNIPSLLQNPMGLCDGFGPRPFPCKGPKRLLRSA